MGRSARVSSPSALLGRHEGQRRSNPLLEPRLAVSWTRHGYIKECGDPLLYGRGLCQDGGAARGEVPRLVALLDVRRLFSELLPVSSVSLSTARRTPREEDLSGGAEAGDGAWDGHTSTLHPSHSARRPLVHRTDLAVACRGEGFRVQKKLPPETASQRRAPPLVYRPRPLPLAPTATPTHSCRCAARTASHRVVLSANLGESHRLQLQRASPRVGLPRSARAVPRPSPHPPRLPTRPAPTLAPTPPSSSRCLGQAPGRVRGEILWLAPTRRMVAGPPRPRDAVTAFSSAAFSVATNSFSASSASEGRPSTAAAKPTLSSLGAGAAAGRSAASLSSAHASRSAYCRPSSASTALVHIDRNFASHGRSLRRERGGAQAAM